MNDILQNDIDLLALGGFCFSSTVCFATIYFYRCKKNKQHSLFLIYPFLHVLQKRLKLEIIHYILLCTGQLAKTIKQ